MPISQNSQSEKTNNDRVYLSAPVYITEDDVIDKLSKEHVKAILKQINNMKDKMKHYQKLEHRYVILERSLRSFGYISGISLEVIAIALQFTLIGLPIGILTGTSGVALPLLTEIIIKLLNLKRQKYLKKISHIKETLDRLYLFITEAKEDKIISLEEIKRFERIIDGFNGGAKEIDKKSQPDIQQQLKLLTLEMAKITTQIGTSFHGQSPINLK